MRNFLFFIIVLFGSLSLVAQQDFTLDEAVQYAIQQNNQIKIQQLDIERVDGQIREYKSIGIPKVNAGVDYQYFIEIPTQILPDFISPSVDARLLEYQVNTETVGTIDDASKLIPPAEGGFPAQFGTSHVLNGYIGVQSLLFDFSYLVGLKAQNLARDLEVKEIDQTEYQVKANVTKAYLAVLIAKENQGILDRNISNLSNLLRETKAIYESGFAEQLDVDRLSLSLQNLQAERENLTRLIEVNKNLLKFQMNYPLADEIQLTDQFEQFRDLAVATKLSIDTIDFTKRPEYAVIQLGEQLNEMNIERIKAGYYPNLTGFYNYQQSLQRNNLFDSDQNGWFPTNVVGVSLNVPIFDGWEKKGQLQQARVDLEKTKLKRIEFERGVTLEAQNSYVIYLNAIQTVENRRNSLDLAQRIYDTTQIKYREGVGSSVEVTQAESELYGAQANYINALYDLVVARTDVEIALGNL